MLLSKLSVPITSRCALQHLIKLPKCLFSKQAANIGKLCPKPHTPTNVVAQSRCEKYKESLEKCSKMQPKTDCKSGATDSGTKDGCGVSRQAVEAFSRNLAKVRKDALGLQIFTRNSVNALASSMDLENATRLKAERSRAISRLRSLIDKIDQITSMSFKCGGEKRNKCYAIHEQIFASLQVWACENASGSQSVKNRLEELECAIKERTDTAVAIVRTCKGCVNPDSLIVCADASANDAACILDMSNEYARTEIASVEQLKAQVLQENSRVMQQLVSEFDAAVDDFDKELNTCIAELKKLQK